MDETLRLAAWPPLVRGRFVSRHKRFIVYAECTDGPCTGQQLSAHLADPGRLKGILVDGASLWMSGPYPPPRKLAWSVVLAEASPNDSAPTLVSLQSSLANRLVPQILRRGWLPELPDASSLHPELRVGRHRIDFGWDDTETLCEVKTVSHVPEPGVGAFPDAPSKRAREHVELLRDHALAGGSASILFVTGRGDIDEVRPASEIDPAFATGLEAASRAGVALLGVRLVMRRDGVYYGGRVPVRAT